MNKLLIVLMVWLAWLPLTAAAVEDTPTADFVDNGDGTVTHKKTGLTWMRCAMGQAWTGSGCSGEAKTYTYDQALKLKASFAGYDDWRLPNIAELQSLVERSRYNPAINTELFPSTPLLGFWSSSPSPFKVASRRPE